MDITSTLMDLLPLVAPYIPTTFLSVVGSIAMLAAGVSKPKSQYRNKSEAILQTIIKVGAFNFGKAENK